MRVWVKAWLFLGRAGTAGVGTAGGFPEQIDKHQKPIVGMIQVSQHSPEFRRIRATHRRQGRIA
ncbi:MAG: hypothetical protein F9K46_08345 [Anaerolineae bacterium]|nr:MAG: hypothetical protein F9K46_08345 [Anaerolineae bacterium]